MGYPEPPWPGAKDGRIKCVRAGDGEKAAPRYSTKDLDQFFGNADKDEKKRETIIYARVSSSKQKEAGDLGRQIELLKSKCPE